MSPIKVVHEAIGRLLAHNAADNYLPPGLVVGIGALKGRGEEDDADGRKKDLAVGAAFLGGSSQSLGQDKPTETGRDENDRPLRRRLVPFREGKEGIGVAEESLYGGIFEVIRIPVIREYAGFRHGCGQHVAILQPVDVAAILSLEYPCSRRFGG